MYVNLYGGGYICNFCKFEGYFCNFPLNLLRREIPISTAEISMHETLHEIVYGCQAVLPPASSNLRFSFIHSRGHSLQNASAYEWATILGGDNIWNHRKHLNCMLACRLFSTDNRELSSSIGGRSVFI